MTATRKTVSSPAGMFSSGSELACVSRLRQKLLLSYLYQQRLDPTFESMLQQTDAHMCGDHLQRLVVREQWVEVLAYLGRFNSRRTVASNTLHFFLHTFCALANLAAGARTGSVKFGAHNHAMALSTVVCSCAKLRSLVKGMLASPEQCVALDSKIARNRAAMIAHDLASQDPDLNRLMQLPGDGRMLPNHVLPIIIPHPRRRVKRLPGHRAPGPAIAKLYLNKRRSLHSSSPPTPVAAFMDESLDQVAGLVEVCIKGIKAGKPQKELQPGVRVPAFLMPLDTATATPKFGSGAPASSQIISGTLTNQAKTSGISPAQNSVLQIAETREAMPV